MIHIEGQRLAEHKTNMTAEAIQNKAFGIATELCGGQMPKAVATLTGHIAGIVAKAERAGDVIVEDVPGRLIAEALGCCIVALGSNPPELPNSCKATPDELREMQRKRLRRLFDDHEAAAERKLSRKRLHNRRRSIPSSHFGM